MKKAHLNRMTWNSEFLAFFILFATNIFNFDMDFVQLTQGCNLIGQRYALKSGIFGSFVSPPQAVSLVPKK